MVQSKCISRGSQRIRSCRIRRVKMYTSYINIYTMKEHSLSDLYLRWCRSSKQHNHISDILGFHLFLTWLIQFMGLPLAKSNGNI